MYSHIRTSKAPKYVISCLIMSVQNYIRVAAHFRAPGACCAVGVLCERLSWQLESSLCLFHSLSCSPVTAAVTLLLPYYLDPSAPLNMSYAKKHFFELTTELWAWQMFHNGSDITITLHSTFYASLCSKFYACFFNSLAIVLDLIFCLRKRVCMVHCP